MTKKIKLYINGSWREGADQQEKEVINPANEKVISSVCLASAADIEDAIRAAKASFPAWKKMPATKRAFLLHKAAGLMRERTEEIARACTLEQGKPLGQSKFELMITANYIDDLAECGARIAGRSTQKEITGVSRNITYEPIGPVYCAAPWNLPAMMPGRKIATALAAGCTVVLKPSEETPETAELMIKCFEDAGLPPGVINLIYGDPKQISDILISSPHIRKISFTGSTRVGKQLAGQAVLNFLAHSWCIISGK